MKKITYVFLILISTALTTKTKAQPNWLWSNQAVATSQWDVFADIEVNDSGVFVYSRAGAAVSISPLVAQAVNNPNGNASLYAMKLDKDNGNALWFKALTSTTNFDYNFDMAMSPNKQLMSFAGSNGSTSHPSTLMDIDNRVIRDGFIAGGTTYATAVDNDGNTYIGGLHTGTINIGGKTHISAGGQDMWVAKIDSSGICKWLIGGGGSGYECVRGMVLSPTGDLWFLTINNSPAATFGTYNAPAAQANGDLILARVDTSNGSYLDITSIQNAGVPSGSWSTTMGIDVDACGNVYLNGTYHNTVGPAVFGNISLAADPSSTGNNIYIAKYSALQSKWLWAKSIESSTALYSGALTLSPYNNRVYTTGSFAQDLFLDNCDTITFVGGTNDHYIACFDQTTGETLWGDIGAYGPDVSYVRSGITADDDGNVYCAIIGSGTPILGGVTLGTASNTYDTYYAKFEDTLTPASIINLNYPTNVSYCPFDLTYELTGIFKGGNDFTVEIDAIGNNFSSPTTIGSLISDSAGTISSQIPNAFPVGTYEIRVIASCPGIHSGTLNVLDCDSFYYSYPTITISESTASISGDTIVCNGEASMLSVDEGDLFIWSPSTGLSNTSISNPIASPSDSITYQVIVTDTTSGCIDTLSIAIDVNALPTIVASSDTTICSGVNIQLLAIGANITTYAWNNSATLSNANISNPIAIPTDSITYTVTVTDNNNCTNFDQIKVSIVEDASLCLFVPNVFSPNNDGFNDVLLIRGGEGRNLKFTIYNRWGDKVFETTDSNIGWDGNYQNQRANKGAYIYTIIGDDDFVQKGNVILIY